MYALIPQMTHTQNNDAYFMQKNYDDNKKKTVLKPTLV